MPPEIGLQVLRDLALAERVGLSGASKPGAALVAEALQAAAVRVLAPFKLRFSDIRLLLTATGSIISGSVVAALAKSGATFEPADLDFLCANRGGQTAVHFLERAGHYKCVRHSEYTFAAGIGRIWTLFNDEGKKINVIESLTPNPFDAVGNFHLTCVYGAWGANGLLHGYPALTAAGDAITTRAKFPIRVGRRHERETWDVIHKYSDRGFRIHLNEYRERHTCGVDWNCPATIRRTDDAGCSYSPFPAWIYDDDAVKMPVSSWTMYGRGCRMGVLAGRFGAVDRASNINGACASRDNDRSNLSLGRW
ncbi:hypothetical protein DFH06DRAFT_1008818 [Mycena polygramma]|nr:hypothetical protein DFH06DRAFT_1008818 [Mycena polygramma]